MKIVHDEIRLVTHEPIEIIDVTEQVARCCHDSGIQAGLVTLLSRHTTAFVNLNEREPELQADMLAYLKRAVPRDGDYRHNVVAMDGRDNAHAHLLGLSMHASETIPIQGGRLMLGEWQSVFFVELDGPRACRVLSLQFLGEV